MDTWRAKDSELSPYIAIPMMHFSSEYVIPNYLTNRIIFGLFLLIDWRIRERSRPVVRAQQHHHYWNSKITDIDAKTKYDCK